MKGILVFIGAVMALSACTKEIPYKYIYKDTVHEKTLVDTESEFLYVASNLEGSRTSPVARPFAMGSEKIVKLKFTETKLQVLEVEKQDKLKGNPTNNKVVLEIPIEHVDYQCAKDAYGECTNQEAANNDVSWNQKSKFIPRIGELSVGEISLLPVEIENLFGDKCFSETGSKVVGHEITPDAVNIQIERTFTMDIKCAGGLENLSDLSSSSVYQYSLVKLSNLTSPNYQPVVYPTKDEGAFGFFSTEILKLNADNLDLEKSKVTLLNRINPSKSEVVYFLNDAFSKPENAAIRKATDVAVGRVNQALSQAGSSIQIVLKDNPPHALGDLRINSLVMVEDPLASGVIGYGPSVANPKTGEIVSARTVMYLGTIKKFIRRAYEEIAQAKKSEQKVEEEEKKDEGKGEAISGEPSQNESLAKLLLQVSKLKPVTKKSSKTIGAAPLSLAGLARVERDIKDYHKHTTVKSDLTSRLEARSDDCYFPGDMVNIESSIEDGLTEIVGEDLRPWEDLSEDEQAKVLDVLVPFVWVPTLVHELGHNLGLRHNFAGSEDAPNYYTKEELEAMGINRPVVYSSVMDYSYRHLNEMPAMGKYDIAALRFGYQRQLELVDPVNPQQKSFQSVSKTIAETAEQLEKDEQERIAKGEITPDQKRTIRNFEFCTDEHVGANAGCKPFDEGTNIAEIAKHFVTSYNEMYKWTNKRNSLRNFSLENEPGYVNRINGTMKALRVFYETYERLSNEFNISEAQWTTIPFLVEIRSASDTAVKFFLDVLKTPDVMCEISSIEEPGAIVATVPLTNLSRTATGCLGEDVAEVLTEIEAGLFAVGQGGKSFQSKKDPKNDNPYVDQIDVRGIWVDKALAAHYLFARSLNSPIFDRYTQNPAQQERYTANIFTTLTNVLLDRAVADVEFSRIDGSKETRRIGVSLDRTHLINTPLNERVNRMLALPPGEIPFNDQLIRTVRREVVSPIHETDARETLETLQVFTNKTQLPLPEAQYKKVLIGSTTYYAHPDHNLIPAISMSAVDTIRQLAPIPKEKIKEIIANLKANKPAPEDATAQEKEAYKLPVALIEAFDRGLLKDEAYHSRLLAAFASVEPYKGE